MLAIIGGTGIYELTGMQIDERIEGTTPFGDPSGPISRGHLGSVPLMFLARHGSGHRHLPHEVNYRANIYALKRAGATMVLSFSAVGSLAEEIAPGDLAMPAQYFDWTRGRRANSFFGDGVAAHISSAEPVSRALVEAVAAAAAERGIRLHRGVTYACVEGPRLGTRAESFFLRQAGCHLVGMTNVPEVFLAREAQLAYATVAIVTDYDCWMDDPTHHATMEAILARYRDSVGQARALLDAVLSRPLPVPEAEIRGALAGAVMTADEALSPAQAQWLAVLRR